MVVYINTQEIASIKEENQKDYGYRYRTVKYTKFNWRKFRFETVEQQYWEEDYTSFYPCVLPENEIPSNVIIGTNDKGEPRLFVKPYLEVIMTNGKGYRGYYESFEKVQQAVSELKNCVGKFFAIEI